MSEHQDELLATDEASATELLQQAGAEAAPSERWPLMLQALVDLFAGQLKRRGKDDDSALRLARELVLLEAQYFGGRMVYLPGTDRVKTALRNDRIWREFRGNNVTELAVRNDLTERQVVNILAEQRAIHLRRVQGDLFEPSVGSNDDGALRG